MGRRRLVTAILFLGLAVSAPAHAAEPGLVTDLNWGLSETDRARSVETMRDLGARSVRLHLSWRDLEQLKGVFNAWLVADTARAVSEIRSTGADVVVMVHETPAWASGSTNPATPPRYPADFGDAMRYLAGQLRGQVAAYEIWNEQNYSRFWSSPSPAAYTALLKAGYAGVKAADPAALVVFGGLSRNDYPFVEAAYAAGAKGSFDVLALHPYPDCGASPETVKRRADGRIDPGSFLAYREVRASMLAQGDDKPIWITEFGWNTSTAACNPGAGVYQAGVSESAQADYLKRSFALLEQDPYVQVALVYAARNSYWARDADSPEARYGLMRTDFTQKASYQAFKAYATGGGTTPPPPPANAAPTVVLTSPAAGAVVGRTLDIAATATDDRGVVKVELWVDATIVKTDTTLPYSTSWSSKKLSPGSHTVRAVAYDADGLTASDERSFVRR